jgi:hypothetical protein
MRVNASPAAVLAQGTTGSGGSLPFAEAILAFCCVVLVAFIVIAVKGRKGNLRRFRVERVRRGIPVLIGLIIVTIVRIMVSH